MGSDVMGPTFLALIMLKRDVRHCGVMPWQATYQPNLCRYTKAVLQGIAAMFRPARKVN
jgi:hypothetical protein